MLVLALLIFVGIVLGIVLYFRLRSGTGRAAYAGLSVLATLVWASAGITLILGGFVLYGLLLLALSTWFFLVKVDVIHQETTGNSLDDRLRRLIGDQ